MVSLSPSEPEHGPWEFTFTREQIGTRFIVVVLRTVVDANDPVDIRAANALQDEIVVRQENTGTFEVPDWDDESLEKVRNAINVLAATKKEASGMFGDKAKLNPIDHLRGTAYGWGGNPREAAVYLNEVPEKNDGKTPYILTVAEEVPVDGFVSVTVYNAKGFMEKNDLDAYSVNDVTAKKNADGSVTSHFGGDPSKPNYLPITEGWNYVVRLYQPRQEILNGTWKFPKAKPID